MKEIKMLIVHSGRFHADDVMCAAIARYINPDVTIKRVAQAPEFVEDGVVVADIGNGKYDHHLPDAKRHEDTGEKYAACGLLLEDCWDLIFERREDYEQFDRTYIRPIEIADNGKGSNPLTSAVNTFAPAWDSEETMDEAFGKATDMLYGVLDRFVKTAKARIRAEEPVKKALAESNGDVVVLPDSMPWQSVLDESTARFVVFPDDRGGYDLQTIPVAPRARTAKKDLPKRWLKKKPKGCTFVHSELFLAAFDSVEHALDAAASIR